MYQAMTAVGFASTSPRTFPTGLVLVLGAGLVGTLKNLLPLLVFALSAPFAWIALAVALALVLMLAVLLGKLVGTWLMVALPALAYVAFMLMMFVGMFGVTYHLWRDVCGTDDAPAMPEPVAT